MNRTPQKDERDIRSDGFPIGSFFSRWIVGGCLLILGIFDAAEAAGDTIYRYRLRDGRVVYSDRPVIQGEVTRILRTENHSPGELWTRWALSEIQAYEARDRHVHDVHRRAMAQSKSRIPVAEQALIRAERAREAGAEPLPGERVGNVNGTSRLRPEYFTRQRILDGTVQDARSNLDRALAADR